MQTPKYDMLRETWIYQEIRQEILRETQQHFLQAQRQLLTEIVKVRFPRLLPLATNITSSITEVGKLHSLIINISKARLEKEARTCLNSVNQTDAHAKL